MGFFDKIIKTGRYEEGANYKLGQSLSSSAIANLFGNGGADISVAEEYYGFAWKAINIRANALSAEDLFVERLVGKEWQPDQMHEFNEVLEGGDGQKNLSELLAAHMKSKDMYGEAFWYFSKGETYGKPMGVYVLDPAAMTVFVSGNRVTGYLYHKDSQRITFELDEIMHFYDEDPRTPFRGNGPMQAAGWFIRSTRYANTYVNNFLENNAIPAGVIVAKGEVADEDWKLFKAQWTAKYSGIDNSGKTGFIRGQDLDFIKTGMSLGEVDFEKLRNTSRDDIMVMFGISKPMFAIFDDINRASAVTARTLFAETNIEPELKSIARKLSKAVANWYGKEFRVNFTNPIPEDVDVKLEAYHKGVGRWFTVNEARAAYGLPPLPGGDDLNPDVKAPEATKSIGKVTIKSVKKNDKAQFSYEMKESFRSKVEDLQKKYEAKLADVVRPVLLEQRDMVVEQVTPKKAVQAHMKVEEEARKLAEVLLPVFLQLAKEQGALSMEFAVNPDAKFELTQVMQKYIADSLGKTALSFTEATQEKIALALASGIENGDSMTAIANAIKDIYVEIVPPKTGGYDKAWRAERLARTEVIKASNEISEAAYRQSGVVRKKEWFANPGHCSRCSTMNGSIINLGSVFQPKGVPYQDSEGATFVNDYEDVKHPPLHPQCRCTILPIIED